MNASQNEYFDLEKAISRIGGGEQRFVELAGFFQSYWRELFDPIEEAWHKRDQVAMSNATHKLKGSLGMLGAKRCYDAVTKLEAANEIQDEIAMRVLIDEVLAEIQDLAVKLREFIKGFHEK